MNTKENRETFIARLKKFTDKQKDIDEIMLAYDLAKEAHRTHSRDTGERYFEHCRATVIILLDELGYYDREAIIALLLHDTGEDSPIFGSNSGTYEKFVQTILFRIEKIFDNRIAKLVILLTKPFVDGKKFLTKEDTAKYYLAELVKNPKALLLKMIDRLHNVRSLPGCPDVKRKKITKETLEVYIPLFETIYGNTQYGHHARTIVKKISEALNVPIEINMREAVCQKWEEEEHEEGWGMSVRSSGYSLHLTLGDVERFVQKDKKEAPKSTGYFLYPEGVPYTCEVDEKTYQQLKKSEYGMRFEGSLPRPQFTK